MLKQALLLALAAAGSTACKKESATDPQAASDAKKDQSAALTTASTAPTPTALTGLQAALKCKDQTHDDRLLPGECAQVLTAENAMFTGKIVEYCPEEKAMAPQPAGWHLLERSQRGCFNGSTGLQMVFKASDTYSGDGTFVHMQEDGNAVFYASNEPTAAKIKTTDSAGHPNAYLLLKPSYKLVVMPATGTAPIKPDFDTL